MTTRRNADADMTEGWDTGSRRRVPPWMVGAAVGIAIVATSGALARDGVAPSPELSIATAPRSEASEASPASTDLGRLCEDDAPVAVIDAVAYPPGHPGALAELPDACLRAVRVARRLGLEVAATPPHLERVGGVYLAPASGASFGECLREARGVDFEIPCLSLEPRRSVETVCAGDCVAGNTGYVRFLRHIPAQRSWCDGCVPKILVAAAAADAPPRVRGIVRCGHWGNDKGLERTFFCDEPLGASLHEAHSQNTMRRGRHNDTFFAISVSGSGAAQRALVERLFDSLVFVDGDRVQQHRKYSALP